MQFDGDAKFWGAISGLIAMLLGWLHIRNNRTEDKVNNTAEIVSAIKQELKEHYMTREQVKQDIRDAREEFRRDIGQQVGPLRDEIKRCNDGIDFLIKFHLDEKKKDS